jgi:hypothetical protein
VSGKAMTPGETPLSTLLRFLTALRGRRCQRANKKPRKREPMRLFSAIKSDTYSLASARSGSTSLKRSRASSPRQGVYGDWRSIAAGYES